MGKDLPKRKEQDLKKTIRQLKAELRQARKALRMAEEEIIRIRDAVDDVAVMEAAAAMARGRRKRKRKCKSCQTFTVETREIDLGVKYMYITECDVCGDFQKTFEDK